MNAHAAIQPIYEAAPDHPERQYLALLEDILANGVQRGDRTGTARWAFSAARCGSTSPKASRC